MFFPQICGRGLNWFDQSNNVTRVFRNIFFEMIMTWIPNMNHIQTKYSWNGRGPEEDFQTADSSRKLWVRNFRESISLSWYLQADDLGPAFQKDVDKRLSFANQHICETHWLVCTDARIAKKIICHKSSWEISTKECLSYIHFTYWIYSAVWLKSHAST